MHLQVFGETRNELMEFVEELQGEDYEEAYAGCRQTLNQANLRLWPRRKRKITLYRTARKTFRAVP